MSHWPAAVVVVAVAAGAVVGMVVVVAVAVGTLAAVEVAVLAGHPWQQHGGRQRGGARTGSKYSLRRRGPWERGAGGVRGNTGAAGGAPRRAPQGDCDLRPRQELAAWTESYGEHVPHQSLKYGR